MKNTLNPLLLIAVSIMSLLSCQKSIDEPVQTPTTPAPVVVEPKYTSEHPYNLNVVYFVPADRQPNPDHHKRLSAIFLDGQEFYRKWMKHWGYGDKTFGLLKDDTQKLIKITTIKGKKPQSGYPYEGGGSIMQQEINEYFVANPSEKKSDHYIVVIALNVTDPDAIQASNVPFYGLGRWCFAIDYPGFDVTNLGKAGTIGSEATKWVGGLLHELGHGLNLPHCGETVSQEKDPNFGTSLMGTGNWTYGRSPTFLTHSSCAILNNCQVFATAPKSFYGPVKAQVKTMRAQYKGNNIVVEGSFTSDVPVTNIIYYHRPTNNQSGYTAMTWTNRPIDPDSFIISVPVSEFREKGSMEYDFSLILVHDNGNITRTHYRYAFKNDVPVIDFGQGNEYSKVAWEIADFSSQETAAENGAAINVLDNDLNTHWHSRYSTSATVYPHFLTIDMKKVQTARGLKIAQRNGSRTVKEVELFVSNDNVNWQSQGKHQLADGPGKQVIYFPSSSTFRYFKIMMNASHDGQQFAALAEVSVFY